MKKSYRYKKKFREKKKKRILPYILFSFLGISIFLGLFYFFIFSSFFFIKEVSINSNDNEIYNFTNNFINKRILFLPTKSVFLFNSNKLKNQLLTHFPHIKKIDTKLNLFSLSLSIDLELREKTFILCDNSNCYNVDESGFVFSYSEKEEPFIRFEGENKEITITDTALSAEEMNLISEVINLLDVEEIIIISQRRINIKTKEDWTIHFNPLKDHKEQIENLFLVLEEYIKEKEKELEYMELRFQDKVYFKYHEK